MGPRSTCGVTAPFGHGDGLTQRGMRPAADRGGRMSRLRLVAVWLTAIAVIGTGTTAADGAAPPTLAWTVGGPGASAMAARLDLADAGGVRRAGDRSGASVLLPGRLGIATVDHDFTSGLTFV